MPFAKNTVWTSRFFAWSWRLAVLALPWQIRFFAEGAKVAGWPWEQGRLSVYVSWIPMLMAVALGYFLPKTDLKKKIKSILVWPFVALGAITILASPISPIASAQWWLQVGVLSAFFVTLMRVETCRDRGLEKFAFWFAMSLLPCAVISIIQVFAQDVWGGSWLGMATQHATDLGVSVLQTSGGRWLRAYGIFPHPNILGVWMALGIVVAAYLYSISGDSKRRIAWLAVQTFFSWGLFYSYSRSAWIAAAVGLSVFVALWFWGRGHVETPSDGVSAPTNAESVPTVYRGRRLPWLAFAVPVLCFLVLSAVNSDLVWSRASATARTEKISVDARVQSLDHGLSVFVRYPFLGTGPGNYLPALANVKNISESDSPLEHPHLVWLLMLDEVGIFGFAALVLAMASAISLYRKNRTRVSASEWGLGLALSAVWMSALLFDHYAWSTWSGQALTAFLACVVLSVGQRDATGEPKEADTDSVVLTSGK